jgi:RNA polymerase sigma-70 factor (ECF subfamily)
MSQRLALDLAGDLAGLECPSAPHSVSLMNSSEDLIRRARAGDQEAFRLIFERYARPVLSFIHDLVGHRDLAEELAQETFVRAYKGLQNIKDETKLSSWLFGIGRNVAREALRSRQKENQSWVDSTLLNREVPDPTQISPAQDLLDKEMNAAMRGALALLEDDWRTVFVLKIFQQCSYQEIADITGFSIGKIKTDLHRARLRVRREMQPFLEAK